MSPKNRSSQYDWFKGSSNNNNPNHRKDSAKTVWKFTKIFLFFSLFFFTMWGCVQTFVVKTNPNVGNGLELYSDEDSISPRVVTLEVSTDTANDIYSINNPTSENLWVNKKEDEKTFTALQDAFKSQGLSSLADANHGGNIAYRIRVNGRELSSVIGSDQSTKGIAALNNHPIIASTAVNPGVYFKAHQKWDWSTPILKTYKMDTATPANVVESKIIKINDPLTMDANEAKYRVYVRATIAERLAQIVVKGSGATSKTLKDILVEVPTNINEVAKHNRLVNQFMNYFGGVKVIKGTGGAADTYEADLYNATPIIGYGKSSYTAIANWGQAWEMGRGSGPFFGLFVYPLSWVTNKLVDAMPMMSGWESLLAIIVVVVAVSIIMFSLTFRGTLQQTKMQEMSAKKAVIEAKYEPYKGNRQMDMRKRQEIQELYKKEGISPMATMGSMFITIPFFLAMWRTVGSIQHIKSTVWLGINFAATSWKELFAGHWQYLLLMAVTLALQVFSALYTRILSRKRNANRMNVHQKDAMKKSNKTQNITIGITCFITIILAAGLQIYFIIRSLWRIFEIRLTHHIIVRDRKKRIARAK